MQAKSIINSNKSKPITMENHQESSKAKTGFAAFMPNTKRFIAQQGGKEAHEWSRKEMTNSGTGTDNSGVSNWLNRDENDGIDFIL